MTSVPDLDPETLNAHRDVTYRMAPELRISTKEQAIAHVNQRGFMMFWPIKGVEMPSLWVSVVGNRGVPDEHDDPGHITWGWKDDLLDKRQWYYAKVLRRKATVISLALAPYFYALSENFGTPEEDYIDQYRQGLLTLEAKQIYEALLEQGPMHTIALRRATLMTDAKSKYRFTKALELLQADFKIVPVGVAEAGTWRYAFIYECVHRHYPELPKLARAITIREAQRKLMGVYMQSVGAARDTDALKVFQWRREDINRALGDLVEGGELVSDVSVPRQKGDYYALPGLLANPPAKVSS